jgi:hypothetical protein
MPIEIRQPGQKIRVSQTASLKFPPFSVPTPECTAPASLCTKIYEAFLEKADSQKGRNGIGLPAEDEEPEFHYHPACGNNTVGLDCDMCDFACAGNSIKFLHWAFDADESHLCPNRNASRQSVSSIASSPIMTARWREFTLTSPTAYVWFSTMQHDASCGSVHTNVLVPVIADKVSTLYSNSERSIDYRDFAYTTIGSLEVPLVPFASYLDAKSDCEYFGDECQTVYHDFQPSIIYEFYPGALSSIDPAWKHCSGQRVVNLDPPIALVPTVMADNMPTIRPIVNTAFSTSSNSPLLTDSSNLALRPGPAQATPHATNTDVQRPYPPQAAEASVPLADSAIIVSKISIITIYSSAMDEYDGTMGTIAAGSGVSDQPSTKARYPEQDSKAAIGSHPGAIFAQFAKEHTVKKIPSSPGIFLLDGSTLAAGGSALTIDGIIVSAVGSGIVVQSDSAVVDQTDATASLDPAVHDSDIPGLSAFARKRKKSIGIKTLHDGMNLFWLGTVFAMMGVL